MTPANAAAHATPEIVPPTQPSRRRYESEVRRNQAADTRDRIVAAGVELVRASSIRDWRTITIRAVAANANVNERTVYRHFANERSLRDAIMRRLEDAADIDLSQMQLADVSDVTARMLRFARAGPGFH